ncbi:hypothetical protein DMUE_2808 [Dictyocoela muelleri]|nr:hypothetical protein DMUE_2808 [Dictyocoela muelleri]
MVDTSFCLSRGFARGVENRSANELIPIISFVVRSGSRIRTDEWALYTSLGELNGYVHQTLIHKYNFVDPINDVHTQHVESFNNQLKLVIKESRGCSVDKRQVLFDLFLFVYLFKDETFETLLEVLKVE